MRLGRFSKMSLSLLVVQLWTLEACAFQLRQNLSPEYNTLSREEQRVLLFNGTEPRFSGKYIDHKAEGTYICRRCNAPLFDSTHKFENECGWPCFDDAIKDSVKRSINGAKTEILCSNCGGHLGHPFNGEGLTPTNVRNCVNSVSLTFIAKGKECPGVILAEEKGDPGKSDANKNREDTSDVSHVAKNQDTNPQTSFELLRNQLLEHLSNPNQDIVHEALSQLEYEYVGTKLVKKYGRDRNVEAKRAIGIKFSVRKQLIELLNSASVDTRELAIQRLSELGPKADDALPKLRELLVNADSRTKLKAAEAIWRISGHAEEAAASLAKLIRDDDEVGPYAELQFELMGPVAFTAFEAIEVLSKDPRDTVRETATKILGSFGPQHRLATQAHLLARLDDASPHVRIAACEALLRIDGPLDVALETLNGVLTQSTESVPNPAKDSPAESLVVSTLTAIGQFRGEAVDAVIPLSIQLNSGNVKIRLQAAKALGQIGPGAEQAIPLLSNAIRDTETFVPMFHYVDSLADNAAEALGSIGSAAVSVLLDALKDPDPMAVVRSLAARELGRIPEAAPQSTEPLIKSLSDPNVSVRVEAIKAIGQLGKGANLAAPELTRLIFNSEALDSFSSGRGIGFYEEWIRFESLRALHRIDATESQVVPTLIDALTRSESLTLEAVAIIREHPNQFEKFTKPLHRLLAKKDPGAACALAALGAKDPAIQTVLANNLVVNNALNPFAAIGIGQLVARGEKLNDALHSQLIAMSKKEYCPLAISTILLRLTPDENAILELCMTSVREDRPRFTNNHYFEEDEAALLDLMVHQSVRDAFVHELIGGDKLTLSQFFSARVLIASKQNLEQAFACLDKELAEHDDVSVFGEIADFLGKSPPSERSTALLLKLLERDDGYMIHGDVYGRGGEMCIVGDRAALALVRHQEISTLVGQLAHPKASVRLRLIRVLADCGVETKRPRLLERAQDSDPSVRLEIIKLAGQIGLEHPDKRNELRPVLENATKDRRRSVSDEAVRKLKRWPAENLVQP